MRRLFLKAIRPLMVFLGKMTAPWVTKKICEKDYLAIKREMRSGDVILSQINGHATNLFIPGKWKHAAIVCSTGVVEAVGDGVQFTSLFDFLRTKDRVCLLRPKFLSQDEALEASRIAFALIGCPYDYFFVGNNKEFYCSELVLHALNKVAPNQFIRLYQSTLKSHAVLPSDFYDAKGKFICIYNSENAHVS